jgi:POT family proton-dependent oligopeptide transporter
VSGAGVVSPPTLAGLSFFMDIVVLAGIVITIVTAIPVLIQLRAHPKGLFVLFFAEMWERFSYYGMRGLLVFYLTEQFLFSQKAGTDQYGAYVALAYLLPLVGGVLADRWLGTRKAIQFGAVLLVIGQLGLAIEGPPAQQVLSYGGHAYGFQVDGRMSSRHVRIKVGSSLYEVSADKDETFSIAGLPADAPLPATLPKGSYTLSVADQNPLFLNLFYLSLSFIVMGVGYLKANISSIVGQLYPQGDPRRDPGFTLYYYGVNLGAFWAGILCGLVGEKVGWWAGFGLAGVGMALGWIAFMLGRSWLQGKGEPPVPAALNRKVAGPINVEWALYLAGFAGIAVIWVLIRHNALVGALMGIGSVVVIGYLFWFMAFRCNKVERERLGLALILIAGSVVFWTLFEQAGTSLNLFAKQNTVLSGGGYSMTAAQTQSFNPGFILIFAPVFAGLWAWLGKYGRDPNPVLKFGLALIQVGAGFLLLVWSGQFANAEFRVPLLFLALAYLLHTTGELCLSPVGLSEVTKLAPPVLLSTLVAVWFLSVSWANFIGAKIAGLTGAETVGGQVLDPAGALHTSLYWFGVIGWTAVGVGVVFLAVNQWLKKWSHGVNDAANHPALATDHGEP